MEEEINEESNDESLLHDPKTMQEVINSPKQQISGTTGGPEKIISKMIKKIVNAGLILCYTNSVSC